MSGPKLNLSLHQSFLGTALLVSCLFIGQAFADDMPHDGIAMDGTPKYSDGFDHFDYVNPDAPKGGELRLNKNGTFDSFNPFNVIGQPAARLEALVYQSLLTRSWDEPFSLYGLIAESVLVSDDRSTITFKLRSEARWSDGEPVTPDDVLFSFVTLRDKGKPNHRTYYKKILSAEKIDGTSVRFTFKPNADGSFDRELPLIMGLMPIIPEHIWKTRDISRSSLELPIGSGPYRLTSFDPARSVTYVRDPTYWGAALPEQKGLHNFDRIKIDYYRDENVAIEGFIAHQYDLRKEDDPNKWLLAYDVPAEKDGRIRLEQFPHHRPEPAEGFVLNTRRFPFKDAAFRRALEYTFDSEWINRNLFHGVYHRVDSFFANSELAAPDLPEGKELSILETFKDRLPPELFTESVKPPSSNGTEDGFRQNLLTATHILKDAGYTWRDGKLFAPGEPAAVSFSILLNDPARKKIALTWARSLEQIGVSASVRMADSAEYQSKISVFDYDVIVYKWINTPSPGNEQSVAWSSAAADQKGSRNYAGVKNPVIDALASAIPATTSREDLVATVHALDRVLMGGHYFVPFYYLGADQYAFWSEHLDYPPPTELFGTVLETWWRDKAN